MAFVSLHYRNRTLGKTEPVSMILPEASDAWQGPFPVLYLLHGIGDDHTDWARRTRIERYVDSLPLIVVMPTTPWQSMYVDGVGGPPAASAIAKDLVEFVDSRFQTVRAARFRAVCGLSMGGYGALHLALTYPDRFGAAASHSGALHFGHDNVGVEPPDDARGRLIWQLTKRLAGDSPRGGAFDLFAQASQLPQSARPPLRIDCGVDDYLIESNRAFHTHLEGIGYSHEYQEHPGAHTWDYWDEHVKESIHYFVSTLGWGAGSAC